MLRFQTLIFVLKNTFSLFKFDANSTVLESADMHMFTPVSHYLLC